MPDDSSTNLDVALSFLAKDEAIAADIAGRLKDSGLEVFFFPNKQEELAGTSGVESMRTPFLKARVVVVLYREPWGTTPWTGIEQSAIQDRCIQKGWESLMFVQLDHLSAIPKWVPNSRIRFSLANYPIEQLVGAIKTKVQTEGGELSKPNALQEAQRVQREAKFLSMCRGKLNDGKWIDDIVKPGVRQAIVELRRLIEEANKTGLHIEFGADDLFCVMRQGVLSMAAGWKQEIYGNVEKDAWLFAREFLGTVILPGERKMYLRGRFERG